MIQWLGRYFRKKPKGFSIQNVDSAYTLVVVSESATLQRPGAFKLGKALHRSLKKGEAKFLFDLRSFSHIWVANEETMMQAAYAIEVEFNGKAVFVVSDECTWHPKPREALHIVSSIELGAEVLVGKKGGD